MILNLWAVIYLLFLDLNVSVLTPIPVVSSPTPIRYGGGFYKTNKTKTAKIAKIGESLS